MTEEKLASNEVPGKFVHWLLAMGCPEDKVPSVEKISEICRGQYYMVWRSLMEHVHARDEIRNKRMQVFCDDVRKCQKKNVFCEKGSSIIVPEQITLWKQQSELRQMVAQAKDRVTAQHQDLKQLMDKISDKLAQRNLVLQKVDAASRRVWLLRQVAANLQNNKVELEETRTIADSLCSIDDDEDIKSKLDKCLTTLRWQNSTQDCNATLNSVASTNGETDCESAVWALTKCRGELLCAQLLEKRAQLLKMLSAGDEKLIKKNKVCHREVLTHTAALHCTLRLEAIKNNVHLKEVKKMIFETITTLNQNLSGEACELMVLSCERAHAEARVGALRRLLGDLERGDGVFHVGGDLQRGDGGSRTEGRRAPGGNIASVDKAIESKREELKRVINNLMAREVKVEDMKECVRAVFGACKRDVRPPPHNYRGIQLDLPQTSFTALREYYATRRERPRPTADLSLRLDLSDGSISDVFDHNNPRFVDELRIYLKNFNLDKNRQLVLDNGDKIWQFETVNSSVQRLYEQCVSNELSCSLLCPSASLGHHIDHLVSLVSSKAQLERTLNALTVGRIKELDISSEKNEEEQIADKTKKRLQENILELQKVNKALTASEGVLKLWSSNKVRKYILDSRKVDGMTYKEYENYYLENCIDI